MDKNSIVLFKVISVIIVCLLFFSIFTFGVANINSDIATATLLSQAQLKSHQFFPVNWNYVNGEIWVFTNNTFVFPFFLFMKSQPLIRMLGSALALLLLLLGLWIMYKYYIRNIGYTIIVLAILFLTQCYEYILYQSSHTPLIAIILVNLMLIYNIIISNKLKISVLILSLITYAMSISSLRYFAEIILPFSAGLVTLVFYENYIRKNDRTILKNVAYTIICLLVFSSLGYFTHLHLSTHLNVNETELGSFILYLTPKEIILNILKTGYNYFSIFGVNFKELGIFTLCKSVFCVLICILCVIVIPIYTIISINIFNKYERYSIILSLMHNIMMTFIIIVCGKTYHYRYLITSIVLFFVVDSIYICKFYKRVYNKIIIICLIVFGVGLVFKSKGFLGVYNGKVSLNKQILELSLKKGYSEYWNAYNNQVYSDLQIDYAAFDIDGDNFKCKRWLVDNEMFVPSDRKTFILYPTDRLEEIENIISVNYSDYTDVIVLGDNTIYIFDYDVCEKFSNRPSIIN